MTTKFNYTPKKFKASDFTSIALALALIIVPIVMPFNIGFRRLVLVPYPYSTILLVIIGIILAIYQVMRLNKEAKLRKSPQPIVVDGDHVIYGKATKNGIEDQMIQISQVSRVDYDSEDEIFTVYTPAGRHKFDGDYFDSKELFSQFRSIFAK